MKVLIIGSGAREHCVAWKVSQSPLVEKLYCAPGNGGTALLGENIPLTTGDIKSLVDFARRHKVDLTFVGPEAPLVEGIVDEFKSVGCAIFGPKKALAQLEGSKIYAKELMKKYGIPTAEYTQFDEVKTAYQYLSQSKFPVVIKADGLAAGKGVFIARDEANARAAVDSCMIKNTFGDAGQRIIIEEYLEGQELSFLVLSDGKTILPLLSSQDHKRIYEGDQGPNTGGMGAYSPVPWVSPQLQETILSTIFYPLINGLRAQGTPFIGVLYAGLILCHGVPYVLEFNVRFGDPETQVILPLLKNDIIDLLLQGIKGSFDQVQLSWYPGYCLGVVLASGGYPDSYEKGKTIRGLEKLCFDKDLFVFHAGTRVDQENNSLVTNGGRVLNVVGRGASLSAARDKVYKVISDIHFDKMYFRRDIGNKALQFSEEPIQ